MKRKKICKCRGVSQCGGSKKMSPSQMKKIMGPVKFRTMPVYGKLRTPLSSDTIQRGDGFFSSIGSAFKKTFSNPLRGIAAVGTFGMSEGVIRGADLVEKATGKKASDVVKIIGTPLSLATGGESAIPTAVVSGGLKLIGKGKKKRKAKKKPKKKRKRKR